MELAKNIPEHYPDLIALGGLPNAVEAALREHGSELHVSILDVPPGFVSYARIESGSRFSQIYIAADCRMFSFDFWSLGVCLAHGATPEVSEVANSIDKWITTRCQTGELARLFPFVRVSAEAAAYEGGTEVETRWKTYLTSMGKNIPELAPIVAAASTEPRLRQLFPFTSLNRLCFSRCTGYPFTNDTPLVASRGKNEYEVISSAGKSLGRGNASDVIALVVAALPPNCGPALPGTAEQFARAQS